MIQDYNHSEQQIELAIILLKSILADAMQWRVHAESHLEIDPDDSLDRAEFDNAHKKCELLEEVIEMLSELKETYRSINNLSLSNLIVATLAKQNQQKGSKER